MKSVLNFHGFHVEKMSYQRNESFWESESEVEKSVDFKPDFLFRIIPNRPPCRDKSLHHKG